MGAFTNDTMDIAVFECRYKDVKHWVLSTGKLLRDSR